MEVEPVSALIRDHLGGSTQLVEGIVHIVRPADSQDAYTLITMGMSERAMTMPPDVDETSFAELMIRLPATWDLAAEPWPVRWLARLAELPARRGTWLGAGHTIPNGDPPAPIAPGSPFVGFLIAPPTSLPEDGDLARDAAGKTIRILAVYPLTAAELAFKLARGAGALIDAMMATELGDVFDPSRTSVV